MKIYKSTNSIIPYQNEIDKRIYVNGGEAGSFIFDGCGFQYIDYLSEEQFDSVVRVGNSSYIRLEKNGACEDGLKYKYVDNNGTEQKFNDKLKILLDNSLLQHFSKEFICAYFFESYRSFQKGFNLINYDKGAMYNLYVKSPNFSIIDDCVYSYGRKEGEIYKLNSRLKVEWSYRTDDEIVKTGAILPRAPIKCPEGIIGFIGPEKVELVTVDRNAITSYCGGDMVCLNESNGCLRWRKKMAHAVDDRFLFEDKLYVVSLDRIYIWDVASGEELGLIKTNASVDIDRISGPRIFVDEKYIYYSHFQDEQLHVFDRNALNLVKKVNLPSGYKIKEHCFTETKFGKHFFNMTNFSQYVAKFPILEVDPNNLESEIEFEEEPDHSVQLDFSTIDMNEKELVIKLTTPSLDDAIRFGEIYTRDETQRYSYNHMNMTFGDRPFTPEKSFNGIVRFIYSGCIKSEVTVNEYLRKMEKRFDRWNEKEGFYSCIDKEQPTKLIAEYR